MDEHLRREAMVMVLYTSIVVMATLIALPEDLYAKGLDPSQHDHFLLSIIWGETVGLALAHWFAFNVAAAGFRGGRSLREDAIEGVAQVGGAGAVALATSVVVLMAGNQDDVVVAAFTTAAIVAIAGFGTSRRAGRSPVASVLLGILILVLGVTVATIKAWLGAH